MPSLAVLAAFLSEADQKPMQFLIWMTGGVTPAPIYGKPAFREITR